MRTPTTNARLWTKNHQSIISLQKKAYGKNFEKSKNFNRALSQIIDFFKKNGGKLEAPKDN